MGNKKIYILGVGHNTIVTIDLAEACHYEVAGLYHFSNDRQGESYFGHKIIGCNEELFKQDLRGRLFAISVGDNDIRADLFYRIKKCGGTIESLIHPAAFVSKYSTIHEGVQILEGSVVDPDTEIGENTIISSKSSILHGCRIGCHCFLAPDVVLGSNTIMDDYAFIGLNATIVSNKVSHIGNHAIIGASAVVTKPVEANTTVAGMPAKIVSDNQFGIINIHNVNDINSTSRFYSKKLLVLAGSEAHVKIVKAAQELGVYVIVTDYLDPEKSPAKNIANEYWMLDINDVEGIVDRCRKEKIDGVLSFCIDPAQLPYLEICEKLGVPCYGNRFQFKVLTDKRCFKDYCKEHDVPTVPEYSLSDVENDLIDYPVLIKPTMSRGSRGQTVCRCKEDVPAAIDCAISESKDGGYLIERYMLGSQDMSFSYCVIDGIPYLLKIGDRYLGDKKDNLERQHIATILPSIHADEYIRNCEPNVRNMIKSLGIDFGAVFLQGFWDDGQIYMYDPGMRFPGGDFDLVLKSATGYDNMKTFIEFSLTGDVKSRYGNPTNAYNLNNSVCVILSVAVRPGVIGEFSGVDAIENNAHVLSVCQRYHEGDFVPKTGDIRQRAIEFVVHLPDRASIEEFMAFVYSNLKILDKEGKDMIVSKFNNNP